jgi:hypothetical protein
MQMTSMHPLSIREKSLIGVIAVLIVVLIVVAAFALVPSSPKYSGDLNVHIDYYGIPIGNVVDFTVFIDGHHGTDGNLTGTQVTQIAETDLSIVVKWSGNETHLCLVEVFCRGNRYATSVWLADGLESSTSFLIRA